MKAKQIYVRLGFSDVVLTKEECKTAETHVHLYNHRGEVIGGADTFLVGYEDEEGNECDEEGNLL